MVKTSHNSPILRMFCDSIFIILKFQKNKGRKPRFLKIHEINHIAGQNQIVENYYRQESGQKGVH